MDCTEHRQLCSNNEVKSYPTLHYFHDGKRIEKYTGGMDKKLLTVTVEQREALKAADVSTRPASPPARSSDVSRETFHFCFCFILLF